GGRERFSAATNPLRLHPLDATTSSSAKRGRQGDRRGRREPALTSRRFHSVRQVRYQAGTGLDRTNPRLASQLQEQRRLRVAALKQRDRATERSVPRAVLGAAVSLPPSAYSGLSPGRPSANRSPRTSDHVGIPGRPPECG